MKISLKLFLSYLCFIVLLITSTGTSFYYGAKMEKQLKSIAVYRLKEAMSIMEIYHAIQTIQSKISELILDKVLAEEHSKEDLERHKASINNNKKVIKVKLEQIENAFNIWKATIKTAIELDKKEKEELTVANNFKAKLDSFIDSVQNFMETHKDNKRRKTEIIYETKLEPLARKVLIHIDRLNQKAENEIMRRFGDVVGFASKISEISFSLVLISIVISFILTFLGIKFISRPIVSLSESAKRLKDGQLDERITFRSRDEIGILADIFNNMAHSLAEKTKELIQSSKMASLGEMSAGIAHEINNPLAIINLNGKVLQELVKHESIDKEAIKHSVKAIIETEVRMAKIVDGLRSYSRQLPLNEENMTVTSLTKIIEDTLVFSSEKFKSMGVKLDISNVSKDIKIKCVDVQIVQVLLNLLNNSYDEIKDSNEKWIAITAQLQDDFVEISIVDSGKGLPKEIQDKIMDPFFTTKQVGEGTGLGLSIAKGIIESHNGSLTLDPSSSNTKFVIKFPNI